MGGKGRGFWCGSCLYIRMGENIHEVRQRRDWRCPCCRDICNCSGANCLRARRNLAVTNQLIHEATKQGFKSVRRCLFCLGQCSFGSGFWPVMHQASFRMSERVHMRRFFCSRTLHNTMGCVSFFLSALRGCMRMSHHTFASFQLPLPACQGNICIEEEWPYQQQIYVKSLWRTV